jgi:hypothetical protein
VVGSQGGLADRKGALVQGAGALEVALVAQDSVTIVPFQLARAGATRA